SELVCLTNDGSECVRALAVSGLEDVPEWGFETEDGISLDFAWPPQKIAVLFEPEDDDEDLLRQAGWSLVSAQVDSVRSALDEADAGSRGAADTGNDDDAADGDEGEGVRG